LVFRKVIKYILLIIVFSLIYIVLRERIDLTLFLAGCVLALLALLISDRFLLDKKYVDIFKVKIPRFVGYIFFLLYRIFVSGARAAVLTVSGKAKHEFFTYRSELDDDFKLNLLANSITLTPGTVTVNREGSDLLVMQLCKAAKKYDITDIKKFEKLLIKL